MSTNLNLYMKSGVSEYWIVDLDGRQILQYTFSQDRDVESLKTMKTGETIRSFVFKDLEIHLDDIFRDLAGKQV